jgi:hypothetical protein
MRIDPAQHAEAEAAIARVLQAEREAEGAIARCRADCAAEVAQARKRAGEIAARAERRIAALTRSIAAAIERRILDLDAAVPVQTESGDERDESAALRRAAEALARELTGAAE